MVFLKGQIPWNKGLPRPLETRLKISQKRKCQHNSPETEFKKGITPWDKGKHIWKNRKHPLVGKKLRKDSIEKISQTRKRLFAEGKLRSPTEGKHLSDLTKLKISIANRKPNPKISQARKRLFAESKLVPWNKGKHHMQKERHPLYGRSRPSYVLQRMKEGLERWKKSNEIIPWNKGKVNVYSAESNRIRSIKSKRLWQDVNYRERVIKNVLKGLLKRPTSLEKVIIELIAKHNLPFEYCGNGTFLIGFKNPDFCSSNGSKICIEVANRFHHQGSWADKRKEHFKKYGWKCLVLWWDEIFSDKYGKKYKPNWEEEIVLKIRNFIVSSF